IPARGFGRRHRRHTRVLSCRQSTCAVNRQGSLRHPCKKAPLAAAGGPAVVHPEEGGRTARSGEGPLAPLPGERKPASATPTKGRISLCLPERIQQKWI